MLKLAIVAGITLSAILCGMMTLRSSGLFQNNKNLDLLTDIKEIFGLYPIGKSNAQTSFNSGESSFSLAGADGGYGGYIPPKSVPEDENSTADMTTPVFRIFILSTSTTTNDSAFPFPTTFSSTAASTNTNPSTTPLTNPSTTPLTNPSTTPSKISLHASPKTTPITEETLTEGTSVSSLSQPTPVTPYALQGNPMPGFKIDLIWSTLVPPSRSNSENEVVMNENALKSANNLASPPPNNGLYLPPNKEYLPPKQ